MKETTTKKVSKTNFIINHMIAKYIDHQNFSSWILRAAVQHSNVGIFSINPQQPYILLIASENLKSIGIFIVVIKEKLNKNQLFFSNYNKYLPCSLLRQYLMPVEICVALYVDDGSGSFWCIANGSNKNNAW